MKQNMMKNTEKKKQKITEKDKHYPENGFVYHDTGYNNLILNFTNINTTFGLDFKYSVIID